MKTTYGQLKNGDKVYIAGIQFEVQNLRSHKDLDARKRDGSEVDVIRFNGRYISGDDSLKGTGFDGGTYGARADVPCFIQ